MPLVLDSTTATPYLCRPIEWGADIVVHSVTKFIGGHGTSIGGAVVESGRFDWTNGKFPLMTEPVPSYGGLSWWGNFAEYGFLTRMRAEQLRDIGATMTPFNAFLFLLGLETLALRMEAHVAGAAHRGADSWLITRAWSGFDMPGSPTRLARPRPALPAEGPRCGVQLRRAWWARRGARFVEAVELCSHLANIGDARTLMIHPASTTHAQLADEVLAAGGVSPDLIRISVGIEDPDDICADLDQALAAATRDR